MKPDWDRLMKEFESSSTALVADVDCTAEGKELCTKVGVKGYPTLKYGDPNNLEDYKGGRSYDDLLTFAKENLGPTCGPGNMDLCDDEQKAKIDMITAKGLEVLEAEIKELDDSIKAAEKNFEDEASTGCRSGAFPSSIMRSCLSFELEINGSIKVKKLQETYEKLMKDKEETVTAAKDKDLGLMKTVRAHLQSTASDKHDEL